MILHIRLEQVLAVHDLAELPVKLILNFRRECRHQLEEVSASITAMHNLAESLELPYHEVPVCQFFCDFLLSFWESFELGQILKVLFAELVCFVCDLKHAKQLLFARLCSFWKLIRVIGVLKSEESDN